MRACYGGHADIVDCLIKHRAEMEARSADGEVALHIAAREGYTRIVRELLANEADVDQARAHASCERQRAVPARLPALRARSSTRAHARALLSTCCVISRRSPRCDR
eukprot:3496263-Prymnesium_polylepis.1